MALTTNKRFSTAASADKAAFFNDSGQSTLNVESTVNAQLLEMNLGGITPYRIDEADGVVTGKAFDALYVEQDVILTTLTDSADADLLAACNITTDVDQIIAPFWIKPATGRTIKAVTVKSADSGVVWGITASD